MWVYGFNWNNIVYLCQMQKNITKKTNAAVISCGRTIINLIKSDLIQYRTRNATIIILILTIISRNAEDATVSTVICISTFIKNFQSSNVNIFYDRLILQKLYVTIITVLKNLLLNISNSLIWNLKWDIEVLQK